MGISCKGILDPLSDYLEGEAGMDVCRMIEEHLDGCEKCRMHVDNMRRIITLYKRWRDDTIPEDVSIRLRDRIAKETSRLDDTEARARRRRRTRKPTSKKKPRRE